MSENKLFVIVIVIVISLFFFSLDIYCLPFIFVFTQIVALKQTSYKAHSPPCVCATLQGNS